MIRVLHKIKTHKRGKQMHVYFDKQAYFLSAFQKLKQDNSVLITKLQGRLT